MYCLLYRYRRGASFGINPLQGCHYDRPRDVLSTSIVVENNEFVKSLKNMLSGSVHLEKETLSAWDAVQISRPLQSVRQPTSRET